MRHQERALHVLFLLTQSLNDPSGLGRYWPLARQMVKLGYQVELAALHPAWSLLNTREMVRDGVKISYVGQMHVFQTALNSNTRQYYNTPQLLAVTARATVALARAALDRRVDAIHIAKAQPMNGLAGWIGSQLRNRRLYLDCDDDETASNRFGTEWQRSLVHWWEERLPRAAVGITVNTSALQERCARQGIPASRVRLVPNGFDPDRFSPVRPDQVEAIRQGWSLGQRRVVLYLGSLSLTNHPIFLLLDAFVLVRKYVPSALLLLVGGGEDYERVSEGIRARDLSTSVLMAGRVDPDLVPSIYAASHLSVDPVNDDETARARSPLKIAESMAMGVPVVTGNTGDRARMLGGGRAGVLVTPGDVQALAEGIVDGLGDCSRHEEMSDQARSLSRAYRWDNLALEFVKIYE